MSYMTWGLLLMQSCFVEDEHSNQDLRMKHKPLPGLKDLLNTHGANRLNITVGSCLQDKTTNASLGSL
jgi:hypothetical protein